MAVSVLREPLGEFRGDVLSICRGFVYMDEAFSVWFRKRLSDGSEPRAFRLLFDALDAAQSLSEFLCSVYPGLSSVDKFSVRSFLKDFVHDVVPCEGLLLLDVIRVTSDKVESGEVPEPTSDERLLITAHRCLQDAFSSGTEVPSFLLLSDTTWFSRRQSEMLARASFVYHSAFAPREDSIRLLHTGMLQGMSRVCDGVPRVASSLSLADVSRVLLSLAHGSDYEELVSLYTSSEDFHDELSLLCALVYAVYGPPIYSESFLQVLCSVQYHSILGTYEDVFDWFFGLFAEVSVSAVSSRIEQIRGTGCIGSADLRWLIQVLRSSGG